MNTRKGFTLVELLVVIAILAILATVSVVGYTTYINNANESLVQQELSQIRSAVLAQDIVNNDFDLTAMGTHNAAETEDCAICVLQDFVDGLEKATGAEVTVSATAVTYTYKGITYTWTYSSNAIAKQS